MQSSALSLGGGGGFFRELWHGGNAAANPRNQIAPWHVDNGIGYRDGHAGKRGKKTGKGGSKKSDPVLSALALLAFLFFLNMLQTSIKDNMVTTTQQPPTMIEMLIVPTRGQGVKHHNTYNANAYGRPWKKEKTTNKEVKDMSSGSAQSWRVISTSKRATVLAEQGGKLHVQ